MAALITDAGEDYFLKVSLGIVPAEVLTLRLFTNNYTPVETSLLANFTESVGAGYAGIAFSGANWVVSGTNPTIAAYPEVVFTFSAAALSVYGYFITRATGNAVVAAEKFTTGTVPAVVDEPGVTIKVSLSVTFKETAF